MDMRSSALFLLAVAGAAGPLPAQRTSSNQANQPREFMSVLPRETSPGKYEQVTDARLKQLAEQGWELAGVTVFVLRNEEHGNGQTTPKPVVTQAYPAYYFSRIAAPANRTAYEFLSVFPAETAPGQYQQVPDAQLQQLAAQGWELVSVSTFVLRNEEHDSGDLYPRTVVTQAYPAYFLKRLRTDR